MSELPQVLVWRSMSKGALIKELADANALIEEQRGSIMRLMHQVESHKREMIRFLQLSIQEKGGGKNAERDG